MLDLQKKMTESSQLILSLILEKGHVESNSYGASILEISPFK